MKKFNRLFATVIGAFLIFVVVANIVLFRKLNIEQNNSYKVVLNRIEQEIRLLENEKEDAIHSIEELKNLNIADMQTEFGIKISGIQSLNIESSDSTEVSKWLDEGIDEYYLFSTDDTIYKISYQLKSVYDVGVLWYVNIIALVLLGSLIAIFLYIKQNILKPFSEFSELPYELAKGNLTKPLKENKNRYFGHFLWGMDLLREHLEQSKARELELQREKKVLLLSLSHDIKTPLNAISLYAKAISRNLYKDEDKKIEVAENIHAKVSEIEGYMAEIIKASNEDFMNFEVENDELYSGEVMSHIEDYYRDKMELNQIDFVMENYPNCLIYADKARLIEVVQNLVENAIKYGDGRKIWVSTTKWDEAYEIVVKNTGCTLEKTELTHIFDSFYRGSNVGNQQGSGLGLFICRKLLHLMDGEILADIKNAENGQVMEVRVILRCV